MAITETRHRHILLSLAICATMAGFAAEPLKAGGFLQTLDVTGRHPVPGHPGLLIAGVASERWATSCIPVPLRIGDSEDPIPSPPGFPRDVTLAQAAAVVDQDLKSWRDIPTSFFDARVVGTTPLAHTTSRFDFVNEVSFSPGPDLAGDDSLVALTTRTTLLEDSFLAPFQDLDHDGDPDVLAFGDSCRDIDGDGDFELPPGFYPAGTLLDADITFNTANFRFTTAPAQIDANKHSIDLSAVLTHELGHLQGLAHVLENQLSDIDGTGSTLYPEIDPDDPPSEVAVSSLEDDDRAWSSLAYPEGTAASGPAALQRGDVAFASVYGLVRGEVRRRQPSSYQSEPVTGASIAAIDARSGVHRIRGAGYSGHVRLAYDPVARTALPIGVGFNVLDGEYEIPLPTGSYLLRIEPVESGPPFEGKPPLGQPVRPDNVNFTTLLADQLGQNRFFEEFWNGGAESAEEELPGQAVAVNVRAGRVSDDRDFVLNEQIRVGDSRDYVGVAAGTGATPGTYFALRIPGDEILAAAGRHRVAIQAAEYFVAITDDSVVPLFSEALLVRGFIAGNSAILDLAHPLRRTTNFVAQQTDFSPFYFSDPEELGEDLLYELSHGLEAVFLVLRDPLSRPFPGVSGLPPLVGIREGQFPIGNSYRSPDDHSFVRQTHDYLFRLLMTRED